MNNRSNKKNKHKLIDVTAVYFEVEGYKQQYVTALTPTVFPVDLTLFHMGGGNSTSLQIVR